MLSIPHLCAPSNTEACIPTQKCPASERSQDPSLFLSFPYSLDDPKSHPARQDHISPTGFKALGEGNRFFPLRPGIHLSTSKRTKSEGIGLDLSDIYKKFPKILGRQGSPVSQDRSFAYLGQSLRLVFMEFRPCHQAMLWKTFIKKHLKRHRELPRQSDT